MWFLRQASGNIHANSYRHAHHNISTYETPVTYRPQDEYYSIYLLLEYMHYAVKCEPALCIVPVLRSLHWLRITKRIEYKLLSLTYKVLTTTQLP